MARERFVDSAQSNSIVSGVFISIALMVATGLLAMLFYWAAKNDLSWVVAILATLMFAYAVNVTAYIAIIREKLTATAFRYYIGLSIFAAFVNLILAIVFFLRASRGGGSSKSNMDYMAAPPMGV